LPKSFAYNPLDSVSVYGTTQYFSGNREPEPRFALPPVILTRSASSHGEQAVGASGCLTENALELRAAQQAFRTGKPR
jgi:hypothetical protein